MGLNMSVDAFLLFALAVIYGNIRQWIERVGKHRGISKVMASERSDSLNMSGGTSTLMRRANSARMLAYDANINPATSRSSTGFDRR